MRPFSSVLILLLSFAVRMAQAVTITVTSTADSGVGTLRNAITVANTTPGADTISFNISGTGVHTITPLTVLPTITEAVTIDGYTQPGAAANTLATGDNAAIKIEINGATVEASQNLLAGLNIAASNCTVRGLAINTFYEQILISSGSGNVISGNFIGTNPAGTTIPGSGFAQGNLGISVQSASNTIGGTAAGLRNVIGVRGNGIEIGGS